MVLIPSPRTSSNLNSIELTSLALESLKRVWEVSGVLWRSLGGLWEVSGKSLGGLWKVSGRSLGGLLGGRVCRRLQKVLDSKSDAIPSENAKIEAALATLPCGFECQTHFML